MFDNESVEVPAPDRGGDRHVRAAVSEIVDQRQVGSQRGRKCEEDDAGREPERNRVLQGRIIGPG